MFSISLPIKGPESLRKLRQASVIEGDRMVEPKGALGCELRVSRLISAP